MCSAYKPKASTTPKTTHKQTPKGQQEDFFSGADRRRDFYPTAESPNQTTMSNENRSDKVDHFRKQRHCQRSKLRALRLGNLQFWGYQERIQRWVAKRRWWWRLGTRRSPAQWTSRGRSGQRWRAMIGRAPLAQPISILTSFLPFLLPSSQSPSGLSPSHPLVSCLSLSLLLSRSNLPVSGYNQILLSLPMSGRAGAWRSRQRGRERGGID